MKEQKIAFFIDDDPNFLELVPEMIQHPHFQIHTYCAPSAYKAIDPIIAAKPDVLFIDFYLPRATGGQILPILKSINSLSHIPIYFMSVHPKNEILPYLADLNYEDVLYKGESLKAEILGILDRLSYAASI